MDEKWDGKQYWVRARIAADPDKIAESLDALRKDREKSEDLEDVKSKAEQALRELERIKQELASGRERPDDNRLKQYGKINKELIATDWYEKGSSFLESNKLEEAERAFSKASSSFNARTSFLNKYFLCFLIYVPCILKIFISEDIFTQFYTV